MLIFLINLEFICLPFTWWPQMGCRHSSLRHLESQLPVFMAHRNCLSKNSCFLNSWENFLAWFSTRSLNKRIMPPKQENRCFKGAGEWEEKPTEMAQNNHPRRETLLGPGETLSSEFEQILRRRNVELPPPPSEEALEAIISLGFDRQAAVQALRDSNNNIDVAASRLLGI